MNGRERILTALEVREPDRVPLYIHGINEESIIGIGRHVADGLPDPKQFHAMTEPERLRLVEALFLIHEEFGVDGFTSFEINQLRDLDATHAVDDWGVVYKRSPHGLPVVSGNPVQDVAALDRYTPPEPRREHLLLLDLARVLSDASAPAETRARGLVAEARQEAVQIGMPHLASAAKSLLGSLA